MSTKNTHPQLLFSQGLIILYNELPPKYQVCDQGSMTEVYLRRKGCLMQQKGWPESHSHQRGHSDGKTALIRAHVSQSLGSAGAVWT